MSNTARLPTATLSKDTTNIHNDAGIAGHVFFCQVSEIATLPVPGNTPDAYEDSATVSTDVTFLPGFCWKRIEVTLEKNALASELVGDRDQMSARTTLTLKRADLKANTLGFYEHIKNAQLIFLIPQLDGEYKLMGSLDVPVTMTGGSATTGDAVDSEKGATMEFSCPGRMPYLYTGIISETPAVL